MPDLGEYLMRCGAMRWESAVHDCCAFPGNWAVECGWPDPMDAWRDAYSTEEEALALIEDAGSLLALFASGMQSVGIPETDEPIAGDLAVIKLGDHEAGAIFTGEKWAFATQRGFAAARIPPHLVIQCWSLRRG